jgi:O-succinylbenzoate synthase
MSPKFPDLEDLQHVGRVKTPLLKIVREGLSRASAQTEILEMEGWKSGSTLNLADEGSVCFGVSVETRQIQAMASRRVEWSFLQECEIQAMANRFASKVSMTQSMRLFAR